MKLIKTFLVVLSLATTIVSCENEIFDIYPENITEIKIESNAYQALKKISSPDQEQPVCLTFHYPFNIYLYDESSVIIDSKIIHNNLEFIDLLKQTELEGTSIGLSFPLSTITEQGELFEITNEKELINAIAQCIESQIFTCTNLLKSCIWEASSLTDNATYETSIFEFYDDGTGVFYTKGDAFRTSWVFVYIENVLFLNIHIEGTSEISKDWNINWKATLISDDVFEISDDTNIYRITKKCEVKNNCEYVEFKECENQDLPGSAQFSFDVYKECIISLQSDELQVNRTNLSFYQSDQDALKGVNELNTTHYINSTNPELIFVKMQDQETKEFEITKIILLAEACF